MLPYDTCLFAVHEQQQSTMMIMQLGQQAQAERLCAAGCNKGGNIGSLCLVKSIEGSLCSSLA